MRNFKSLAQILTELFAKKWPIIALCPVTSLGRGDYKNQKCENGKVH